MSQSTRTYRVIFHSQGKVYEIYAKGVHQSGVLGFVEVEKLVFGEKTTLVVDPSEEHLKAEFAGVTRIDEVEKEGHGKITAVAGGEKVTPFPFYTQPESGKN